MRTTLTIDDDVAALLEAERRRSGATFKETVNQALRKGLTPGLAGGKRKRFRVKPIRAGLPEGLSYDCIPALLEALEGPGWR